MLRLADYITIVGFDHDKERSGISCGIIEQRFPINDWPDVPFINNLEPFCQPHGWSLSNIPLEPTFIVSVLTDVHGEQHHCCSLSFTQPVSLQSEGGTERHSLMYAPKCLVLISRLNFVSTFRKCLGLLYTAHVDNLNVSLEVMIAKILGGVYCNPYGGVPCRVQFTLEAGDLIVLEPPESSTVPVTAESVYRLFSYLGIHNATMLVWAAMTELKILVFSRSYTRLHEACAAIVSLMYPFKYSHVYIPLLPAEMIEVLHSPTPFLIGIHTSLKGEIKDVFDVTLVDLDGGSLTIPECVTIPSLPEPLQTQLITQLCMVLRPELLTADAAFPSSASNTGNTTVRATNAEMLDKEIRATFLRLLAYMFHNYRAFLTLVRIHPKPYITFHKAAFIAHQADFFDPSFVSRLVECMFFERFVSERGIPYRVCDLFDEVCADQATIRSRDEGSDQALRHIRAIAMQLYKNEHPPCQGQRGQQERIPQPTEGAFTRIHQPAFPRLNAEKITQLIEEYIAKRPSTKVGELTPVRRIVSTNVRYRTVEPLRRYDVVRSAVACIFDKNLADARKALPAVLRALKQPSARLVLAQELAKHAASNKVVLEHPQFDLVVRLMNAALQDDSALDQHVIAALMLPLSQTFCRKLSPSVTQFAYTCIYEHAVWSNISFWESAFYQDVQKVIRNLYLSQPEDAIPRSPKITNEGLIPLAAREFFVSKQPKEAQMDLNAMEIAAQQLRLQASGARSEVMEFAKLEEQTVYAQVVQFVYCMTAMRVPLDVTRTGKSRSAVAPDSETNSAVTNSMADTNSESNFEDDVVDVVATVRKFIDRFVDKVCLDASVGDSYIKQLHDLIPANLANQMEMAEAVYRESRRLPPVIKPRLMAPVLLPGEHQLLESGLRVYLLRDGRTEENILQGLLIPSEGALFLTNYRVLFKGTPIDPLASEQMVIRGFPIYSLLKEKKVVVAPFNQLDFHSEGLQLRSNTFELIRVAFDAEVSSENVDVFRKMLSRVHCVQSPFSVFALAGRFSSFAEPLKPKEKHATLKVKAKRRLLQTAARAGIKTRHRKSASKYFTMGVGGSGSALTLPPNLSSPLEEVEDMRGTYESPLIYEYQRLGLTPSNGLRTTYINVEYKYCRTYPSVLIVPHTVQEESVIKVSHCYRQNRFPVVVYRHKRSHALVFRGSGFHGKGFIHMLRGHPTATGVSSGDTSSWVEQEKYVAAAVRLTPRSTHISAPRRDSIQSTSSSLFLEGIADGSNGRRTSTVFQRAITSLRGSTVSKTTDPIHSSRTLMPSVLRNQWDSLRHGGGSVSEVNSDSSLSPQQPSRVYVYIFGEQSQMKDVQDYPGCSFIPVEFPEIRQVKQSFKKLSRACCPSGVQTSSQDSSRPGFFTMLEQSEWFSLMSWLFKLSGAVVDLVDWEGSSVMLCMEDGWDITCQVSSIAQICMDPYYRTFEGFRVLIEKEWLAFGYRFMRRSTQAQPGAFVPLFLQFLDCVHQLLLQFPMAFEFNDFFLKFLAYHHVSGRFRNFLMDCECERAEFGLLSKHPSNKNADSDDEVTSSSIHTAPCVFEHASKLWNESPVFYNFFYSSQVEEVDEVLRPVSNISNLELWDYYVEEALATGSPYDVEIMTTERSQHQDDSDIDTASKVSSKLTSVRRIVIQDYDHPESLMDCSFSRLLNQMSQWQSDQGQLPTSWTSTWSRLEALPKQDSLTRQMSFNTRESRSHGRRSHKRSTLEVLVKGKSIESSVEYTFPHHFVRHTNNTMIYCDYCSKMIFVLVKSGLRCSNCGYNCHEECAEAVLKNCNNYSPPVEDNNVSAFYGKQSGGAPASLLEGPTTPRAPPSFTPQIKRQSYAEKHPDDNNHRNVMLNNHGVNYRFDQFKSESRETSTLEGYLFKRGALLKSWKSRWYVLDVTKHQIRYYDSKEEAHCHDLVENRGVIDLADVVGVFVGNQMGGALRKTDDDKAFFDVRTRTRVYNFMAPDAATAQRWVDTINSCLQ